MENNIVFMKHFPFEIILDWYTKNGRHDLPWRQYFNLPEKERGYRVWLSEIILQQTQVSRWVLYFEKILKKYPHVEDLAKSSYEDFFEYYKWLGYYTRARNMLKTAQIVVEEYNGVFPKETYELTSLPGIWPYTAEAIRAFAYEIPTLSFDTNLLKIFSRYYFWNKFLPLSKEEKNTILQDYLQTWISPREINAALMDFANFVSLNNTSGINFDNYPLKDCEFFKSRWEKEPEKKKPKESFPTKNAFIEVHLHENHKQYFSHNFDNYEPFVLPPYEWDTREYIKKYFLEKYNLELSVRPISKKWEYNWKFFVLCNAQIQTGKHTFWIYKKSEM